MTMNNVKLFAAFLSVCITSSVFSQSIDPWKISTPKVDPSDYYGVTVANGMIGIVSSPNPFRVQNVVLAGVYDLYGRGRVSNFLNSFNLLNMNLEVNGHGRSAQNMKQTLDMQHASFTSEFDYEDFAYVKYTYYALRLLRRKILQCRHQV
jgi:protein-glucosylgalactosylhydroxylysine glucosidase